MKSVLNEKNIIKIDFTNVFNKRLKKIPVKIVRQFRIKLEIFIKDNFNSVLNNHCLIGKFKNYRSININGDWRALYSIQIINNQIHCVFEFIGTHSQLYG